MWMTGVEDTLSFGLVNRFASPLAPAWKAAKLCPCSRPDSSRCACSTSTLKRASKCAQRWRNTLFIRAGKGEHRNAPPKIRGGKSGATNPIFLHIHRVCVPDFSLILIVK